MKFEAARVHFLKSTRTATTNLKIRYCQLRLHTKAKSATRNLCYRILFLITFSVVAMSVARDTRRNININ